jgi:hypothetical protein
MATEILQKATVSFLIAHIGLYPDECPVMHLIYKGYYKMSIVRI